MPCWNSSRRRDGLADGSLEVQTEVRRTSKAEPALRRRPSSIHLEVEYGQTLHPVPSRDSIHGLCRRNHAGGGLCHAVALPLTGPPAGPTISDVAIEAQTGDGIVVLATATDPQGGDNLRDVLQTIGVFPDERCEGDPILLQDDLVDSGVEESFGIAASASSPLLAEIAASTTWPVSVDFSDLDGNRVTANVIARIIPVDQGVVAAVPE
jgi:hypothetical protein